MDTAPFEATAEPQNSREEDTPILVDEAKTTFLGVIYPHWAWLWSWFIQAVHTTGQTGAKIVGKAAKYINLSINGSDKQPQLALDQITEPTILYASKSRARDFWERRKWGIMLIAFVLGAFVKAYFPVIRVETNYHLNRAYIVGREMVLSLLPHQARAQQSMLTQRQNAENQPQTMAFNPLFDDGGRPIIPADTNFGIIIPKLGINAKVIPYVDPGDPKIYNAALKQGVAHAATSYFPNQDGSVYLFSHSTNYEWYVKDLNALFYLLKNLENGDFVVLVYRNTRYTYTVSEKKIVPPSDIDYVYGRPGRHEVILQTCWPPGTVLNRMLIFAQLVDTQEL